VISLIKTLGALLLAAFIAGCGSNFEWFPDDGGFNNNTTATQPVTAPGTVMREIPFPSGVQIASDIFFDRSSGLFWLLAGTSTAPLNTPNVLVQLSMSVNTSAAAVVRTVTQTPGFVWPLEITGDSNMVFDGTTFWITSHGLSGGVVPVSQVYQLLSTGQYLGDFYTCPATSTGFCQGLAWDSTTSSFWSAASNLVSLVNYQVINGTVSSAVTYTNLWTGSGVTDVSFDSLTGQVFVIRNGVMLVQGNSGTLLGTIAFTVPGSGRGDWDGQFFWVVDNTSRSLKALFVR